MAEELCLELAKGVLPVLEESTDPALMELAKGVLPVLEETTDPALLLFWYEWVEIFISADLVQMKKVLDTIHLHCGYHRY